MRLSIINFCVRGSCENFGSYWYICVVSGFGVSVLGVSGRLL